MDLTFTVRITDLADGTDPELIKAAIQELILPSNEDHVGASMHVNLIAPDLSSRLEYLRGEIRAERISWGELIELQSLAEHIEPGDVELLEWAGVPEFPPDGDVRVTVTMSVEIDRADYIRRYGLERLDVSDISSHMRENVETLLIYQFDRSRLGTLVSHEATVVDSD